MACKVRLGRLGPLVAGMVWIAAAGGAEAQVLAREPASGSLRPGERVLVDDNSCPRGQIKEIVGGRSTPGKGVVMRRVRRCIPR